MSKIIRNKYKEKIRDGEKVKELDCPEGFKSVEGKCVPMSSTEKRHRSDAAHKVKRNHGIIQKYIDDKRIETMKDKKDEDVQKLKNVIREELKRILNESPDTVYKGEKRLYYQDMQAKPFGYVEGGPEDGKFVVGRFGEGHDDLIIYYNGDIEKKGRIWTKDKVISFWKFPSKSEFKKAINQIQKLAKIKIWNNNWYVETASNKLGHIDLSKKLVSKGMYSVLIPVEDYLGEKKFEFDETQHIASPMLKKILGVPKGVGSRKTPTGHKSGETYEQTHSRMKMDGINNQGKILSENDKNDLEKALKNHDWNFQYSDDNRLYKQGKNEWENIKSLMIKVGKSQSKSLWKKFAPKNQKFPDSVFNPKIITKSTDKGERWYPTENIGENKMNKLNERKLSTLQKKYSDFFFDMLDQFDVKSPAQLSSDKKKEFFNRIKKEWPKEKRKTTNEGKIEIRDIIREIVLDELVDKDMLITIAKDRDFGSSIQNLIEWFSNAAKTMDHSKKKDMKDVVVDYVNRILSKV